MFYVWILGKLSTESGIGVHAMCLLLSGFDQLWNAFSKFMKTAIPKY